MINERLNTLEAGDLMDEVNAHRLRVNYGPHLVRVTRRDMQRWMPTVLPAEPLVIDPDPALEELIEAIRKGGREAYRGCSRCCASSSAGPAPRCSSRRWRSSPAPKEWCSDTSAVYLDARVDPETLTHSKASLAQALVRQGLVQRAMRGGGDGLPLLRGIVAQTLAGLCGEEQVLVFAERVWCLRQLAQTMRERHGIEAYVADGQVDRRRVRGAQGALHRRRVPGAVPVASGMRATTCRPPRPHAPRSAVGPERPGAAGRPRRPAGPRHASVQTYIPYIRGAGLEHVVSVLAPRGGEHHQILDSFEGVAAERVTIATQLGEITGQVAESKHHAASSATAARLRVAASVFGADRPRARPWRPRPRSPVKQTKERRRA